MTNGYIYCCVWLQCLLENLSTAFEQLDLRIRIFHENETKVFFIEQKRLL